MRERGTTRSNPASLGALAYRDIHVRVEAESARLREGALARERFHELRAIQSVGREVHYEDGDGRRGSVPKTVPYAVLVPDQLDLVAGRHEHALHLRAEQQVRDQRHHTRH